MPIPFRVSLALSFVFTACGSYEQYGSRTQAELGCFDHVDHYTDENGDEVQCVYTDEPGPVNPCLILPQLCGPPDDGDPCATDPSGCNPPGEPPPSPPSCTASAPPAPPDVAQEVANRVAACFQINWSQVGFHEATDAAYNTANDNWMLQLANWAAQQTGCAISNLDYLFYGDAAGNQAVQSVITRLNQDAAQQQLQPHQKICSAMCASARMLEYSLAQMANVFNSLPNNAVESGLGTCREFSQIAARILTGMGFTSSVVMNTGHLHAYVEVASPSGGTFYLDPQYGLPEDCVFYNRH